MHIAKTDIEPAAFNLYVLTICGIHYTAEIRAEIIENAVPNTYIVVLQDPYV